jgi:hypothetical protein
MADDGEDSPYEEENWGGECWGPGEVDLKEAWYSSGHKGPLKKVFHKTADGDIYCCEECMGHTEYMGHCSCGYDVCMKCMLPEGKKPTAAAVTLVPEEVPKGMLLCSGCRAAKPAASYSSSQLKKKGKRKCAECNGVDIITRETSNALITPKNTSGEKGDKKDVEKIYGCLTCGEMYPASGYSASQLKKKGKRKCMKCNEETSTTPAPITKTTSTTTTTTTTITSTAPVSSTLVKRTSLPALQAQLDAWVTHFDIIAALTPGEEKWAQEVVKFCHTFVPTDLSDDDMEHFSAVGKNFTLILP